jgi:hypothetical protein
MLGLMLHTGAEPIEYDALRTLPVPAATQTHCPIAHSAVVEMVKYSLGFFGHEIADETYGVTPDGARFFGLLSLRSTYADYTDTVGIRNSHDKKFPIGISFGSRVFVCDNLAFSGDHVIKRKHTPKAKYQLPSLVAEIVEPLRENRLMQAETFGMYQATKLSARHVDHAIMQLFRDAIIGVTKIADVLDAYEKPPCDWGGETAYRLFNAATFTINGRVMETPGTTAKLHKVIDGICEDAFWDKTSAPMEQTVSSSNRHASFRR